MRAGDAIALSIAGLGGGFGLLLILGSKGFLPRIPFELPRPWEGPSAEPSPEGTPAPVATGTPSPTAPWGRPAPTPTPQPSLEMDAYKEWVGSLGEFRKGEDADHYQLGFGFVDHQGKTHRVSCQVSKAAHAQEVAGFGYEEEEMKAALQAYIDEELRRRDLTRFVRAKASGNGAWEWESQLPGGLESDEMARRLGDIAAFGKIFDDEFPKQCRLLFKQRGFLFGKVIEIDYAGIARRSTPHLRDCFDALAASGLGYNERQYLGLFVAFFQEIPYQLPPDHVGHLELQGFWVPTEVLVGDHGDCDSKSVAFAAMWRNFRTPVIIIEIPDHVLVGVEVRPRAGEKYVLLRNHYFVLGEVAGPGKRHPGDEEHERWTQISGHFQYSIVSPAEGGPS